MKKSLLPILLSVLVLAFPATVPAGQGKDHGHKQAHQHAKKHADGGNAKAVIAIPGGDRDFIRAYLGESHGKDCPPGLRKKNNGCLPPGIAKKYSIGQPLPDDVIFSDLPGSLLKHLGPPPRGYRYVQVDKDVLLIGEATKKVVDAVTLLSAVGN